jgi:GntR family transcriptional regulator/MocR family aminotransferase
LAPALRVGFLVAPAPMIERLARERFLIDRQGDLPLEIALSELIEEDELGRHARKMRRIYQARRDAIADLLRRDLGDVVSFRIPTGGMALWAEVDPAVDVDRWAARALEKGVSFQPGSMFTLARRKMHAARFGFASANETELALATKALSGAVGSASRSRRRTGRY